MSRPEADLLAAAAGVAPIPGRGDAPAFAAPWEAQVFAITLALHERGLFTWGEWAVALGATIREARASGDPDDGSTYYAHWLAATERLVAERGVAGREALAERAEAFERAARATPHGEPIRLANDPSS